MHWLQAMCGTDATVISLQSIQIPQQTPATTAPSVRHVHQQHAEMAGRSHRGLTVIRSTVPAVVACEMLDIPGKEKAGYYP